MSNIQNMVKIKVIGVGGGGNNAVLHIIEENVQNIQTYLLNTGEQKHDNKPIMAIT